MKRLRDVIKASTSRGCGSGRLRARRQRGKHYN
jgi:hypothetical protein